jgi:4-methylaminobutanoate oxidase (formaldehyde-forming)
MEADITVCKRSWDEYIVIATDTMHRHVETLLRRNLDPDATKHVCVSDITGGYTQINIQGPHSRALMQTITDTDMSNEAFPFRAAREISIGLARVMVARITYVGELGYELHIPTEFALHVYELLVEKGKPFNLVHCGLKALSSLRLEKGYKDYGHDMDNLDTLIEVGLGFTADFEKPGGFVGKEAVMKQNEELKKNKGLPRRLVQVLLSDPKPMMYHGELVWRNDVCVGEVRVASYGHTLGGAVGLAMIEPKTKDIVNKSYIDAGKWEVEVAGTKYPAQVSLQPFYDPKNSRIKA